MASPALYVFSELDKIDEQIYEESLSQASAQRREKVLKLKFHEGRVLSLSAYRLLCFALKSKNAEFSYNEYGKPLSVDAPHFNIAHSKGLAACVTAASPIGVDVELIKPYPEKILKRVLTENEIRQVASANNPGHAFFTFWTLKESYIKAIGKGLSFPLLNVEFVLADKIECSDPGYEFTSRQFGSHIISTCAEKGAGDISFNEVSLSKLIKA